MSIQRKMLYSDNSVVSALWRPVCGLLGCTWPIVLAGMGGVARADLVTAVTLAGGFGFLGMVREPTELIRDEVRQIRTRTDRKFGVNLIPAATAADLLDAQITTCIELGVPVVGLFWDVVPAVIRRLRDAGILVIYQVGSIEDARAAEAAGAQVLIAQGQEAGGHVRGDRPLGLLLREIVAATSLPVLAAQAASQTGSMLRPPSPSVPRESCSAPHSSPPTNPSLIRITNNASSMPPKMKRF